MKKAEKLTHEEVQQLQRCAEIMFPYFRGLVEDVKDDKSHPHRDELEQMEAALKAVRKRRTLFY